MHDLVAGTARAVVLSGGERIDASAVVTAVDVQTALLDLLDPPLAGRDGVELRAAHRGNAVQMLVHVATDRLPPYPGAGPGDWNGLQSHVDTLDELRRGFPVRRGHAAAGPGVDVLLHAVGLRRLARAVRQAHRLPRLPVRAVRRRGWVGGPAGGVRRRDGRAGRGARAGLHRQHHRPAHTHADLHGAALQLLKAQP